MSGAKWSPSMDWIAPLEAFELPAPIRHRTGPTGTNGLPGLVPYTYRPGEDAREAEVQAELAAIRARLAR
jgi:hypothetical protein